MKEKIIGWLILMPILLYSQPTWKNQPKWFGLGIVVGYSLNNKNIDWKTITFGASIGKIIYDLDKKQTPDPFTIGYGSFIGGKARLILRHRKRKNFLSQ